MIPDGIGYFKRRHARGEFMAYERLKAINTTVYRLIGPDSRIDGGLPAIRVHAWIPEHHRGAIAPNDLAWVSDGVLLCRAYLRDNKQTLAPFLASGDLEWDVRETE
jgi:hypothetical protein